MRRPGKAVDATMLAASIGIDRTVEPDVGRFVAGDDLARGIERDRGLERRQFVQALPAIVEGDPRFGLEPAARVGLRAAATPSLALDRDREFGKRCHTRRLGGRRYRRVLEGMRGCSAHEANIARHRNKSRTSSTTIHRERRHRARRRRHCRKILHANGCFDYDKVITVRRFSPFEPTKPHSC